MFRAYRIFAVAALVAVSGGCYTLIKQPGPSSSRGPEPNVVREFRSETIFQTRSTLPWPEVSLARSVGGAYQVLDRVQADSASTDVGVHTDFLRQMLLVVSWGQSPPANLVIDNVTAAGHTMHVFVRAQYTDFRENIPPTETVQSPVLVARVPLHDGNILMHMGPRYAWNESQRRWLITPTQWSTLGELDKNRIFFEDWNQQPMSAEEFVLE